MVEIPTTIRVPGQRIADLATTGIEGGYSPWLKSLVAINWTGEDPWYASGDFWDGFFQVRATFDGPDDDEGSFASTKIVGPEDLQRAFVQLPANYLKDFLDENEDAETGDVFLQLLILGEVVYG